MKIFSIRKVGETQIAAKKEGRSSRNLRKRRSNRRSTRDAGKLKLERTQVSVRALSETSTSTQNKKTSSRRSDTSTSATPRKTSSRRSGYDENEEKSGRINRFLDLSGKVTRKMITFASSPIRRPTMERFITRVEKRRMAEKELKGMLNQGDVSFPRPKKVGSGERRRNGPHEVFVDVSQDETLSALPLTTVADEANFNKGTKMGHLLVTGNNDNDGQVIVCGKPFWIEERDLVDNCDSDTAEDLPLNAEVVLEVDEGNLDLATVPTIPVILDPFADLNDLQKRDKLFFNKPLLFGNSVRSMINLSDITSVKAPRRHERKNTKRIVFTKPISKYNYTREKWWRFVGTPFIPTNQGDFLSAENISKTKSSMDSVKTETTTQSSDRSLRKARRKSKTKPSRYQQRQQRKRARSSGEVTT
ncbi:hypothetical protein RB195_014749 [Necator americanus]|uniref:Uncharacterized protein n=1 Tax=Necator americanus TaxID=51031 RepID=A0ABR1E1H6_NECAM